MHDALKTKSKTRLVFASKSWLQLFQMLQHGIEKSLPQFWIAGAIGVRKRVFVRSFGRSHRRKRPGMQSQSIAHVVEAQTVSELGIEQSNHMTPRTKGPCLLIYASLARQSGHQMWRNKIAKLVENGEPTRGWLDL